MTPRINKPKAGFWMFLVTALNWGCDDSKMLIQHFLRCEGAVSQEKGVDYGGFLLGINGGNLPNKPPKQRGIRNRE